MGYEEAWKVLADLVAELRRKGETIPADVMDDLRSAKTMIQIFKADLTHTENIQRIETYLESLEFHLISVAQDKFGTKYVEQWLRRLEDARTEAHGPEEAAARFVPGLPKGERWMRIHVSDDTPREEIEKLAEENKLSHKMQDGGYVLIHGGNEQIKSFVKKFAERFRNARKI